MTVSLMIYFQFHSRYIESRNLGTKCQMCERSPKLATVMCEQCEIFYCDKCQASCHPQRGPLAKHSLVNPTQVPVANSHSKLSVT